jgi:hypothetical protein
VTVPSEPRDPGSWRRLIAELEGDRARERADWGDVDEDEVARYVAGTADAGLRTRVEEAMGRFPAVRQLVDNLTGNEALPFGPASLPLPSRDVGGAGGHWTPRPGRRPSWKGWAAGAGALAASLLIGFLIGRRGDDGGSPPSSGELLLAAATPQPRLSRSGSPGLVGLDARGVYLIEPGQDFGWTLQSPRAGQATIAKVSPLPVEVWPRAGQAAIPLPAFEPRPYGPFIGPEEETTFVVVVTAGPAADVVRDVLTPEAGGPAELDRRMTGLPQALWAAGHRWAAIARVTVRPASGARP